MADKKKIALLGAGTMGIGIAQMFAQAGHEVKLIYVYDDKVRARPREAMEAKPPSNSAARPIFPPEILSQSPRRAQSRRIPINIFIPVYFSNGFVFSLSQIRSRSVIRGLKVS